MGRTVKQSNMFTPHRNRARVPANLIVSCRPLPCNRTRESEGMCIESLNVLTAGEGNL